MLWVLDYRWDLAADFRALYRLSPTETAELPGPEFFALAYRVSAYDGVMAVRMAEVAEPRKRAESGSAQRLTSDPALSGLIDYSG